MKIIRSSRVWNLHAHSKFSAKDALPDVKDMVTWAKAHHQPALGLTDHGNMAGAVQLYKECSKAGILPFPGTELYVVHDRKNQKAKRHHLTVVAYTTEGYKNLVNLSTLSHQNFFHKPLVDHSDLASLAEEGLLKGVAASSGCFSGFVQQAIVNGMEHNAYSVAAGYAQWFDKFYIELMNHEITWDGDDTQVGAITDSEICDVLVGLAQRLGLPAVLTQDSHYCDHEDAVDHDSLKRLVSFGPDPDDAVFSGGPYGLADEAFLKERHEPARYELGVGGLQDLIGSHDLAIPQLDSYHYNIPFTVEDPQRELANRTRAALSEKGLSSNHKARLEEELEIIEATGMAGYLILVAEVTDWCRENKVFYQARGSAAGSMCCWLLGITPVDPIKWKLSFDRFISRDRTKPPDIDLDVEHWRRRELMNWLASRFSTCQIGNWAKNKLSGEVDPDTGEEVGKGSLRVQYFQRKRATGAEIGTWADVPADEKAMLYKLDGLDTYKSYGVHAAGVILTTSKQDLDELVPKMYVASSETFISQYAMGDVEELGLVKLDVLGLKTLSVLHRALDFMGREVELDWIPLTDSATFRQIASGDTDGIFQLEGWTARKGVAKLKPTKVADVIAAMALFRPATMDSGATAMYIEHKHGKRVPQERHPILQEVTKDTQHILLYQEQVISVLRAFGMDPDSLTKFLKAVKASNQNIGDAGKVIDGFLPRVLAMAEEKGVSSEDWDWLWNAITGFAAYGFNRAHSTVYGLTAYRCAYLVTHYPAEFHAALLAVAAGSEKEANYVRATRRREIRMAPADVNRSDVTYTMERGRVRKGLTSIKGVGEKAAQALVDVRPANGFESVRELCELVTHRAFSGRKDYLKSGDTGVGVLGKLAEAGALEGLREA